MNGMLTTPFARMLLLLSAIHAIILAFRLPVLESLPGWVWCSTDNAIHAYWPFVFTLAIPLAALTSLLRTKTNKRFGPLVLIVFVAISLQVGFSLLEGRGIEGLRKNATLSGHSEFFDLASRVDGVGSFVSSYERRVVTGQFGNYCRSKPVGTPLLYIANQRIASLFIEHDNLPDRCNWARTFASIAWPCLSALVIFPIFGLVAMVTSHRVALTTCTLYALIPSVNLVTLHTDGVFYPTLFVTTLFIAALAKRTQSPWIAWLSGALAVFCCFFSVGLAPVLPLGLVLLWFAEADCSRIALGISRTRLACYWGAGVLASWALILCLSGMELLTVTRRCLSHHASWLGCGPSITTMAYSGMLNILEFSLWTGIPVFMLALFTLTRFSSDLKQTRRRSACTLVFATFLSLAFMAFFGQTTGEVNRLWLYMVPLVCMAAAIELSRLPRQKGHWALWSILLAQLTLTTLTKAFQDFG